MSTRTKAVIGIVFAVLGVVLGLHFGSAPGGLGNGKFGGPIPTNDRRFGTVAGTFAQGSDGVTAALDAGTVVAPGSKYLPTAPDAGLYLVSTDAGAQWDAGGGGGVTGFFGAFSSLPDAGNAGRVAYVSDSPVTFVDNGSTWLPKPAYGPPGKQVPTAANWTIIDTVTAAPVASQLTDRGGTLRYDLAGIITNNQEQSRIAYRSWPAGNVVVAHVVPDLKAHGSTPAGYAMAGLAMATTGSTPTVAAVGLQATNADSVAIIFRKMTTLNTVATFEQQGLFSGASAAGIWLKVEHTGGNYLFSYAVDGFSWTQIHSEADSGFTVARSALWLNPYFAHTCGMTVDSWSE